MKGTLRCAVALAMVTGCVEWSRVSLVAAPDVPALDGGATDVATADASVLDVASGDTAVVDASAADAADVPRMDAATDLGADASPDAALDRPVGSDAQDAGAPGDRPTPVDVPVDAGMDVPPVDVPPECRPGMTRPCYTGPAGTEGRGICLGGTQSCAVGRWESACPGQVLPIGSEVCGNATDDDCDGMTNEGCVLMCGAGTSNCNGNDGDGCEVAHMTAANTCGAASDLGTWCGDTNCGTLCNTTSLRTVRSVTGNRSTFYRGRIADCAACANNLNAVITLAVPAGVDYDLYVYRPCGTLSTNSSTVGAGMTERVVLNQMDLFTSNESFDYVVEVRWRSGASCSDWTLTLEARANSGTTCP